MKFRGDKILHWLRRLQLDLTRSTYDSIPYIVSGIASAIVCSLFSRFFQVAEDICLSVFEAGRANIFLIAPLCFTGAWLLVKMFAPGSAGSGIPQVLASLDDRSEGNALIQKLLSFRVIFIKIMSASLLVLGGGAIGREGPSIQISAAIFYKFRELWVRLGNRLVLKNMLVAGGAGGIAAAFNTPLGGVIYAVEELARDHLSNFRIGLLEAVITAGLVAQMINGPYLYLGLPAMPKFEYGLLPTVILIAAVAGLLGALFGRLLFWGLRARVTLGTMATFAFVLLVSSAMALLVYAIGSNAMGSGIRLVNEILFEHKDVTLITVIGRFFGPILSALTGASGGIFAPALSAGATVGEYISMSLNSNLENLAPICGMIAFLTGVTRTPVTAFVLILEMTDRHSAIMPMMLTALIAVIFARIVDRKSFYEKMSLAYVGEFELAEAAEKAALQKVELEKAALVKELADAKAPKED